MQYTPEYQEALEKCYSILYGAKVKFCFISGTALSLYRGDFQDKDIDIGIFDARPRAALMELFLKEGFEYAYGFGDEAAGLQDTVLYKGVKIDLNRVYLLGDKAFYCAWDGMVSENSDCQMIPFWVTAFEPVMQYVADINPYMFPLPGDIERYFTEQYGAGFMKKVDPASWHFARSPANAVYSRVYCKQTLGVGK